MLLAIPALRALRAEGRVITLAAQPRIGALLVGLGAVDRSVAFDTLGLEALFTDAPLAADAPLSCELSSAARVVCWFGARDPDFTRRLREIAPGAVIALPATTSVPAWVEAARAEPVVAAPTMSDPTAPSVDHTVSGPVSVPAPSMTVWQHLLQSVAGGDIGLAVGASALLSGLCEPVALSSAVREQGRRALRDAGWDGRTRVVVVHPGAGGVAKRWPTDGFVDVIADLDATVVAHEGPADADAVRALLERLRGRVLALVDPPLPTLAGALAEAAGYLGNDSGISHLAAAVGTPSVVLFTPAALPWVSWSLAARSLTVSTAQVAPAERDAVRAALMALL